MKVIFNADDFGLTPGVNAGIARAHRQGVVKSTTMMVGMAAEADALALAAELPELKIGLHLRFTAGAPFTGHPSLTSDGHHCLTYADFWRKQDFDPLVIYQECRAQVEYFLRLGLPLSHIDSHHHVHRHPQLFDVIKEVASEFRVPMREVGLVGAAAPLRYHFSDRFYDHGVSMDALTTHLHAMRADCDVLEVMCHPAEVDHWLAQNSGYTHQREQELQLLTSAQLMDWLVQHDIRVTDYSELGSAS